MKAGKDLVGTHMLLVFYSPSISMNSLENLQRTMESQEQTSEIKGRLLDEVTVVVVSEMDVSHNITIVMVGNIGPTHLLS